MRVGSALHDRERYPFGVDHQMALRARFAAIRRIRAGLRPCGSRIFIIWKSLGLS